MMFSRLWNWLWGSGAAEGTPRQIFVYHDGKEWRRADPTVIGRMMETQCPGYEDHLATVAVDSSKIPPGPARDELKQGQDLATVALVNGSRQAFGIRPLDDGGLTEAETIHVLADFLRFMANLSELARPH